MSKQHKIPTLKQVKTSKVISNKRKVKDPVRNPKVLIPIEKQFTSDYIKVSENIVKMIQVELIK